MVVKFREMHECFMVENYYIAVESCSSAARCYLQAVSVVNILFICIHVDT